MATTVKTLALLVAGTGAAAGWGVPDPAWEAATPLPAGRDHHVTFVTGGPGAARLNVAGGTDYAGVYDTYWSASIGEDGELGEWSEAAVLPQPLAGHGVAVREGGLLIVAGQRPGLENVPDVWHAALDKDGLPASWSATAPLPAARFHHTTSSTGEWVYVVGGLEARTATATVFRGRWSDAGVDSWVVASELPEPRSHHAAVTHAGALYVIGGQTGNPAGELVPHATILRAELATDGSLGPWREAGRLDSAFATHAAFVRDGVLYVAGGVENNRRVTDRVVQAAFDGDGTLGAFEPATSLPRPRSHVHQMPVYGGNVYTAGGSARREVSTEVFIGRWR